MSDFNLPVPRAGLILLQICAPRYIHRYVCVGVRSDEPGYADSYVLSRCGPEKGPVSERLLLSNFVGVRTGAWGGCGFVRHLFGGVEYLGFCSVSGMMLICTLWRLLSILLGTSWWDVECEPGFSASYFARRSPSPRSSGRARVYLKFPIGGLCSGTSENSLGRSLLARKEEKNTLILFCGRTACNSSGIWSKNMRLAWLTVGMQAVAYSCPMLVYASVNSTSALEDESLQVNKWCADEMSFDRRLAAGGGRGFWKEEALVIPEGVPPRERVKDWSEVARWVKAAREAEKDFPTLFDLGFVPFSQIRFEKVKKVPKIFEHFRPHNRIEHCSGYSPYLR
ncbi:hypothetical protein C8R43DRAFT_942408 [Mycena crocata]|nr:hypothetical protein C8R43DRAFT_942408 [Mycena crocata]